MTPYETLAADWLARPRSVTLEEQELRYKRVGFVFSTHQFYAMGRAVVRGMPDEQIRDPYVSWSLDACDAWYVAEMCGDMRALWSIMPWRLPFIGWCSAKDPLQEVRFYPICQLERLTGRTSH